MIIDIYVLLTLFEQNKKSRVNNSKSQEAVLGSRWTTHHWKLRNSRFAAHTRPTKPSRLISSLFILLLSKSCLRDVYVHVRVRWVNLWTDRLITTLKQYSTKKFCTCTFEFFAHMQNGGKSSIQTQRFFHVFFYQLSWPNCQNAQILNLSFVY